MTLIPFFDYSRLYQDDIDILQPVIEDILARGAYILQADVRRFEENLATFVGAPHVISVANGTDALMLALRALGIGPGHEVIVPSHTYVASVAAIHFSGATPVLVECGLDHLIDPEDVERKLTSRTRAIMPVHLNGRTADMARIGAIADREGLLIVEDAAQGVGSTFMGRHAGTFGAAGTYSFYPAKTLGCFGDGGAVVTNDDDVARSLRLLCDHGRDDEGLVVGWGVNSRLDNLQAAILDAKLSRLDKTVQHRRSLARVYVELLADVDAVFLPPGPDAEGPHFDAYQNFEIKADRRDDLRAHLKAQGIGTVVQWGGTPVHHLEALGLQAELPITDALFERCLLLPMNQSLSESDARRVASSIREFYKA
jgi:dTDP-4-amino-4,6-dideoxygalactose transaminase